ncbi:MULTISPECIES: CBS domain-containing protein [unclassified Nocardiopsis]|jgi:CBS domain-containing protein|uniref:CBS domain-containing protein n=1 Tax=unclassified Nocardiopsis TaxID=2649073 RepID=UPI00066D8943|nr:MULTISPECIES: CBS domain-containing protein [unclassified Nocardiopsis]MBQ1080477.1 CBS domain-containing protein [Nocardiopsis sp. B62]PWV57482.1 CBS domain-containing protein [Nocardiopsis sp. L17-MgMaSL7]
MLIAAILRAKGPEVVSVAPEATVARLLTELARHNVGAVVVAENDTLVGIVSERDVVRHLERRGPELMSAPVSDIMTSDVVTCTPDDTVEEVSEHMTVRRFRHVPVTAEGRLAGIVSIGDLVKSRLRGLEDDRAQLEAYIHGR